MRRILSFVMLVCIPFAWMWMLPDALENFGQSLVSTSLFSNNLLLMVTSGYWDLASEYKPLMHTWSLAVEEQFYIIFPIFLIFAWRIGKNKVLWLIIFLSLISFTLSEYGWRLNSNTNFYNSLTRAWELLAGSIAAKYLSNQDSNSVGIVGAGIQARLQLQALMLVRDIKKVTVWARDLKKADEFKDNFCIAFSVFK